MSRTTLLTLLAGVLVSPALAQPFETAIGNPLGGDDVIDDTIWVRDLPGAFPGGPASVGWTFFDMGLFGDDMYVVRQDASGAILWDTILFTEGREQANEIVSRADFDVALGYAVVGETDAGAAMGIPGLGISLTFLDAFGGQAGSRLYLGTPFIGGTQGGADVFANSDGGFAISGRAAFPDVPVFQAPVAIRTGPGGFPIWSNWYLDPAIGAESFGSFADIHEYPASDGTTHFIATGYMAGFDGDPASRDTLVVRLDSAGGVVWSNLYRFPHGEEGLGIEITENREIVITGRDHDPDLGPLSTSFMMRLTGGGGLLWYNRYFGFSAVDGSVREVGGSRLATVGVGRDMDSPVGSTEALLLRTGPGGTPFSTLAYGGERDEAGDALDTYIADANDSGFVIGAHTDSYAFGAEDFYVLKTDASGKTGCEKERQTGWEPVTPQIVELQLRPQPQQENITWQWNQVNPGFPFEYVCDSNPCPTCACDFAAPLGVCDFSDVVAFLGMFAAMDPCADMALPFGTWDFSDVVAFLGSFGAGCP